MAGTPTKPFVYWGSGSGPCWKVLLVLREKGIDFNDKLIEFSKKEHKSEEVLKLNPRGQVPTFYDGDVIVNESNAVCMYLEDKYPQKPLFPTDPKGRAQVYQRMFETQNLYSKIAESIIYYKMRTKKEDWDKDVLKDKYEKATEELQIWEKYIAKGEGYLVGKDFTMADVFFFPIVATLVRQGAKLEAQYPNLAKYYKTLSARPSVSATFPPHWSDTPCQDNLNDLCD